MASAWPNHNPAHGGVIDSLPFENLKNIYTAIDFSILEQAGYWEKLNISRPAHNNASHPVPSFPPPKPPSVSYPPTPPSESVPGFDTIHFQYDDIRKGTNDFAEDRKLGQGAFGKVYKVELKHTMFACKVLSEDLKSSIRFTVASKPSDLGNELRFLAEYRHPNVIPLYGWSLDGEDPCLIYQFMEQGSLQDRLQRLSSTRPLEWKARLKIACDAARGLQYLHTAKEKPLIHGDIKSANILLDSSFTAKLGDFGLAREGPRSSMTGSYIKLGDEHTPGTIGYLAKEYMDDKKLSVQVDTYAFGVVLLELYTGRRAFDRSQKGSALLRDYMEDIAMAVSSDPDEIDEDLYKQQDPQIAKIDKDRAIKLVKLGLKCCSERRNKRPSMSDVLDQLAQFLNTNSVMVPETKPSKPISKPTDLSLIQMGFAQPPSLGRHGLSRNPVESEDTSLDPHQSNGDVNSVKDSLDKLMLGCDAKKLSDHNMYNSRVPTMPPSVQSSNDQRMFQPSYPPQLSNMQPPYLFQQKQGWSPYSPYNNQPQYPPTHTPPHYPPSSTPPHMGFDPNYHKSHMFLGSEDSVHHQLLFPPGFDPKQEQSDLKLNLPDNQPITPEVSTPELFSSMDLNQLRSPNRFPEYDPYSMRLIDVESQNNNNSSKMSGGPSNTGSISIRRPGDLLRGGNILYPPQVMNKTQLSPQYAYARNDPKYFHAASNSSSPRFNPADPNAPANAFIFSSSSSIDSGDSGRISSSTIEEKSYTNDTRDSAQLPERNDDTPPAVEVNVVKERLLSRIESGCDSYSQMFSSSKSNHGPSEG